MRSRLKLAVALAVCLAGASGHALPRRPRGASRADIVNSFTMVWTTTTATCGQFKLGTFAGASLWYDDGSACPAPLAAQATLTESGAAPFPFALTLTDSAAPNTASVVTLTATDGSGAFIKLHLNVTVDGQAYTPGTYVLPMNGMVSNIQVAPTVYTSSSAGCYDYGTSSNPPNQQSCGHALVAPTPGAAAGTTGQHEGYYQGSALLVAYM